MKLYLLIILIFLFSEDTLAQSQIYKVQPGRVIMQSLPVASDTSILHLNRRRCNSKTETWVAE
jgi:hypothetical protein